MANDKTGSQDKVGLDMESITEAVMGDSNPDQPEISQVETNLVIPQITNHETAKLVIELEKAVGLPIWLLINKEGGAEQEDELNDFTCKYFLYTAMQLEKDQKICVLIHSPGGNARCAYQLSRYITRYCGAYDVLIPSYAKSAATLFSLGAENIILGDYGELGPLDAQIFDSETERIGSALDEVHALERLHAFALDSFDATMYLLLGKSGKKVNTLLPMVLKFISDMMEPLLDKIDTVHYTQLSRALKVGEEYAVRLLSTKYGKTVAEKIARTLVEKYPEHGFVIDREEANSIGLKVNSPTTEIQDILDTLMIYLGEETILGRYMEGTDEK